MLPPSLMQSPDPSVQEPRADSSVTDLLAMLQQLLVNNPSLQYNPAAQGPLNALKQIQAFLSTQMNFGQQNPQFAA